MQTREKEKYSNQVIYFHSNKTLKVSIVNTTLKIPKETGNIFFFTDAKIFVIT